MDKILWITGFAIGATWAALNFVFTASILKIALLRTGKKPLAAILLLKFPVLYLVGFLILNSRRFPISGLLGGLSAVIIALGAYRLWPKRT
jgi:hypothetical protein